MKCSSSDVSLEKQLLFQRMFSALVMALMLAVSFLGVFTVPFDDDSDVFFEAVDSENRKEFKEGAFVTYDPISACGAVIRAVTLSSSSQSEYQRVYYDVSEDESHSIAQRASGIAYLTLEGFESDLCVGIYYSLMMFFTISAPVLMAVALVVIFLKYRKPTLRSDGHDLYRGSMNWLRIVTCHMAFGILLTVVAPKVSFGWGGMIMTVLLGVAIAANMVVSHKKDFTATQRKYRNMLHVMSAIGVLIFAIFCFSLIKSNTVAKVVRLFDAKTFSDILYYFKGGNFDIDEIIHLAAGVVFMVALFCTRRSLGYNLCRLGLITTRMKKKDYSSGDSYIALTVAPNLMILVYWLLVGSKAELMFYKEEVWFFVIAMACVVAMTLVEVLITILKETLCIDLGSGGRDTVLEGNTYSAQTEEHMSERVASYIKNSDEKNNKESK